MKIYWFSNYKFALVPIHLLYSTSNTARLRCFMEELAGWKIEETILWRFKMYSINVKDTSEGIRRAKGIGRASGRNVRPADYLQTYFQHSETTVSMTVQNFIAHGIHTTKFNKHALWCWEDKRVSTNEPVPHGSVLSPVSPTSNKHVLAPPSGDAGCAPVVTNLTSCLLDKFLLHPSSTFIAISV